MTTALDHRADNVGEDRKVYRELSAQHDDLGNWNAGCGLRLVGGFNDGDCVADLVRSEPASGRPRHSWPAFHLPAVGFRIGHYINQIDMLATAQYYLIPSLLLRTYQIACITISFGW